MYEPSEQMNNWRYRYTVTYFTQQSTSSQENFSLIVT